MYLGQQTTDDKSFIGAFQFYPSMEIYLSYILVLFLYIPTTHSYFPLTLKMKSTIPCEIYVCTLYKAEKSIPDLKKAFDSDSINYRSIIMINLEVPSLYPLLSLGCRRSGSPRGA